MVTGGATDQLTLGSGHMARVLFLLEAAILEKVSTSTAFFKVLKMSSGSILKIIAS
jgi:hypothetical protein